jgi:UDP-glucose:(heptosyl)LPS alpha-1,3-glucosyltransferase
MARSNKLRIGYVYRDFNRAGSLHSFFVDRVERLARDEDVVAVCSAQAREVTEAPVRFATVEPMVRGRGRLSYAVETATFAIRATRKLRQMQVSLDLTHVVGYCALEADLVTVNGVRPAEAAIYFDRVEPDARVRRHLNPLLRPQSGVVQLVERALFRAPFPICLVETRAVGDDLERCYGVPHNLVEVLPSGVDRTLFRFDATARLRVRSRMLKHPETVVVLFVGDDFERKGLARAIAAVARVESNVELWVAGAGRREPYEAQARRLGCDERVRFLGRIEHRSLPATYSAADIVLLLSVHDAWGQSILEAAACGRTPIASEYTGAHELINDGANGFVVSTEGHPEQVAALLSGPLASADVRARLGENALRTAAAYDRELLYGRLRDAHHCAYERKLGGMRAAA